MITAREIIREKGEEAWSVHFDASVFEALRLLADKNVGVVPGIDKGKLVDIQKFAILQLEQYITGGGR